ncbi:MAG: DUF4416 family protein [Candidatus Alcyoniella australis]|nr:DUF4416 family protein [Candidatus Alcyoniella australis]
MSTLSEPHLSRLICELLVGRDADQQGAIDSLIASFGPIELLTQSEEFDYSDYYYKEMGSPIFRRLAVFSDLVSPRRLVEIKLKTNELEDLFAEQGRRGVNIDPELLSEGSLILATGKPAAQRIYLDHGIYAELRLVYQDGNFQPLAWTHPDYREQQLLGLLSRLREKYLIDRRTR